MLFSREGGGEYLGVFELAVEDFFSESERSVESLAHHAQPRAHRLVRQRRARLQRRHRHLPKEKKKKKKEKKTIGNTTILPHIRALLDDQI